MLVSKFTEDIKYASHKIFPEYLYRNRTNIGWRIEIRAVFKNTSAQTKGILFKLVQLSAIWPIFGQQR